MEGDYAVVVGRLNRIPNNTSIDDKTKNKTKHTCIYIKTSYVIPEGFLMKRNVTLSEILDAKCDVTEFVSPKLLELWCTHYTTSDEPGAAIWTYYFRIKPIKGDPKKAPISGAALIAVFVEAVMTRLRSLDNTKKAELINAFSQPYTPIPLIDIGVQTEEGNDTYLHEKGKYCKSPTSFPSLPLEEAGDILAEICRRYGITEVGTKDRDRLCALLMEYFVSLRK